MCIRDRFEKDSAVYQKLIDTALIYEQYCEFIKNEYISSDDVLSVAAGKMSEAKYTSGAEVWPVSYTHLDVYKRQALKSLQLEEAAVILQN